MEAFLSRPRDQQETSEQLLAAILDLSPKDRPSGHGSLRGTVNVAEQTSLDIIEVDTES